MDVPELPELRDARVVSDASVDEASFARRKAYAQEARAQYAHVDGAADDDDERVEREDDVAQAGKTLSDPNARLGEVYAKAKEGASVRTRGCVPRTIATSPGGVLLLGVVLAVLLLLAFGYLVQSRTAYGVFFDVTSSDVKRFFAVLKAELRPESRAVRIPELALAPRQTRMTVIHRSVSSSSLLTPERLLEVFDVEETLQGRRSIAGVAPIDDYGSWCHSVSDDFGRTSSCTPVTSVLAVMLGTSNYTREDVEGLSQDTINTAVRAVLDDPDRGADRRFFFPKATRSDGADVHASQLCSRVDFGMPLRTYGTYSDSNQVEQEDEHGDWVHGYTDVFKSLEKHVTSLQFYYLEDVLWGRMVSDVVNQDWVLAAFGGLAMLAMLAFQTASLSIAVFAVVQLLICYPMALVFYHGVLDIDVNPRFNLFSLMVLLGLGAGDVCGYVDVWKQSAQFHHDSLRRRLAWTWNRACPPLVKTCLVTIASLVAMIISPLPAVSAFATLMAIQFALHMCMMVTLFPAFVYVWSPHLEERMCIENPFSSEASDSEAEDVPAAPITPFSAIPQSDEAFLALVKGDRKGAYLHGAVSESTYRRSERVCFSIVAPTIYRLRYVLLVLAAALLTVSMVVALRGLAAPSRPHSGLPSHLQMVQGARFLDKHFYPSATADSNFRVSFFWGLESEDPVKRGGLDGNDLTDMGSFNYLSDWELDIDGLRYIRDQCRALSEATVVYRGEEIRLVEAGGMKCIAEAFLDEIGDRNLTTDELATEMVGFLDEYDPPGSRVPRKEDAYHGHVGVKDEDGQPPRIRFVRIEAETTISGRVEIDDTNTFHDRWLQELRRMNTDPPASLKKALSASELWAIRATHNTAVRTTLQTIGASFGVGVLMILLVMHNWVLTVLVSVAVNAIVWSVLLVLLAKGESLGNAEVLCFPLVMSLAFHTSLRLAFAFLSSTLARGRYLRCRIAILESAVGFTAGAVTTATGATVLAFAVTPIFYITGQVVLLCTASSLFFTFAFLLPALMVVGPHQHPVGDVVAFCRSFKSDADEAEEEVRGRRVRLNSNVGISGGQEPLLQRDDDEESRLSL